MTEDQPDWFTDTDRRILRVLATGLVLTPSLIACNTSVCRGTVSSHLNKLLAAEYVEKIKRGKYQITRKGQDSLSDPPEVSADD